MPNKALHPEVGLAVQRPALSLPLRCLRSGARALLILLVSVALRPIALVIVLGWSTLLGAADLSAPVILVAKPQLRGDLFSSTVLVVTPLGGDQHVGFIVNRPTNVTLGKLFAERVPRQKAPAPLYFGGPLDSQVIFALVQRPDSPGGDSFQVMPGLFAAFEVPIVDSIIKSESDHARFVAGLVAWRRGELRDEVDQGAWYVLEPDAGLVMRHHEGLWEELVRRCQQFVSSAQKSNWTARPSR
jgi:putative transcriptional regulator